MIGFLIFLVVIALVAAIWIAEMWSRNNYIKRKEKDALRDKYQREKKWWEV